MANEQSATTMAHAAANFLGGLEGPTRERAVFASTDDEARRDWHYIPRRRGGLAFIAMDAAQQKAAYDLVASGLSISAVAAVTTILGLEDVLDEIEGKTGPRRVRRAPASTSRPWGRHRADYSVSVFGDPEAARWGWRFEGHHVSLNVSVIDGEVASTPLFLGSNPAEVLAPSGSVVVRPLAGEEDLALALFGALDGPQRDTALLGPDAPDDILTTNAPALEDEGDLTGVRLAKLGPGARSAAEILVRHYIDRLPPPAAEAWWQRLATELGDVRFAFAGEARHRRPQYYRLTSPSFFVEYDNTQDDANHVHTVLRDPGGDFGEDLLRRHRAEHHDEVGHDEPGH